MARNLDSELSELSGQACQHAYAIRRWPLMQLAFPVSLVVSMAIIWRFSWAVVIPVAIAQTILIEWLVDTRVIGLADAGIVHAKATWFRTRPRRLLSPTALHDVEPLGDKAKNMAPFRIGNRRYIGLPGSTSLAAEIRRRRSTTT